MCVMTLCVCVCVCVRVLLDSDQYQLGAVQCLVWSPVDYSVLVVVWRNGGLSMWSVFGSLLFHSLGNQPG